MSSTWNPTAVRSLPLSPVLNPFVTPPHVPNRGVTPDRVVTPDRPLPLRYLPSPRLPPPSPYYQPQSLPLRPPSQVLMDPSPVPTTSSADLTPEQHVCLVRVLKCLDEWFARGWEPRVDKSRLRSLAEVFNSAEAVAEGGLDNLRLADLAWRLADSEGWEKSAGSSIMGAIDIQVTVTKILYKDYGNALIDSFRSFLGRKELELGNSGRPGLVSGLLIQEATSHRDSKPVVLKRMEELAQFARKGMREADYLLTRRIPAYRRMMKRAGVSPTISPLLAKRLTANGETSYFLSNSPLPELTPSAPNTPSLHCLIPHFSPSPPVVNSNISWLVEESSPMPIPLADIDVSAATPLDTGPVTMTELVSQYMEDLLTREFCPIPLDEDLLNEDI
ncbi:hypothetical protein SCLCIDRAFT_20726 [Scleroderma citrinum Foug A]|uniref:Uncharacterized protein n=1 Tax=Scleroderma citrinum Foug A TaxID=1036808 RepID=A0A0C3A205_9AGAM|nr:hypothetical protein SCLCIDRAFT_20726 [Scleroderma citrinum Foug A]